MTNHTYFTKCMIFFQTKWKKVSRHWRRDWKVYQLLQGTRISSQTTQRKIFKTLRLYTKNEFRFNTKNFNSVLMNSKALFLFRIIRYLKSCDWNVDEAEKMLRNTLEYRRRNNIADIDCRWCHERPGYHTMVSTGIS